MSVTSTCSGRFGVSKSCDNNHTLDAKVAVAVLRRLRKRQLRWVNQQLDEILADSTIAKDGSFTKNL